MNVILLVEPSYTLLQIMLDLVKLKNNFNTKSLFLLGFMQINIELPWRLTQNSPLVWIKALFLELYLQRWPWVLEQITLVIFLVKTAICSEIKSVRTVFWWLLLLFHEFSEKIGVIWETILKERHNSICLDYIFGFALFKVVYFFSFFLYLSWLYFSFTIYTMYWLFCTLCGYISFLLLIHAIII